MSRTRCAQQQYMVGGTTLLEAIGWRKKRTVENKMSAEMVNCRLLIFKFWNNKKRSVEFSKSLAMWDIRLPWTITFTRYMWEQIQPNKINRLICSEQKYSVDLIIFSRHLVGFKCDILLQGILLQQQFMICCWTYTLIRQKSAVTRVPT